MRRGHAPQRAGPFPPPPPASTLPSTPIQAPPHYSPCPTGPSLPPSLPLRPTPTPTSYPTSSEKLGLSCFDDANTRAAHQKVKSHARLLRLRKPPACTLPPIPVPPSLECHPLPPLSLPLLSKPSSAFYPVLPGRAPPLQGPQPNE